MTPAVVAASPTTAAIPPSHAPERLPRVLCLLTGNLPAALVLAACAWWLLLAPRLEGGRGAGAVTGGAILTALAVLAIRPDRVLPKAATWLALWVSAAAFAVALLAPTGWAGAPTAASYVCASWTVVAVAAAVVRTPKLRNLMLLLVVARCADRAGRVLARLVGRVGRQRADQRDLLLVRPVRRLHAGGHGDRALLLGAPLRSAGVVRPGRRRARHDRDGLLHQPRRRSPASRSPCSVSRLPRSGAGARGRRETSAVGRGDRRVRGVGRSVDRRSSRTARCPSPARPGGRPASR